MHQRNSYVFDTTGVVVIKQVLTEKEVNEARDVICGNWPTAVPWKFPVMHLGRIFWRMLTDPIALTMCDEFCGEHFRLDHAFGVSSNGAIAQLHGGPQSSQHSCFYAALPQGRNRAICGQLNVGFCLEPQCPNTGGFIYLPGSHKASDSRSGQEILEEIFEGQYDHHSLCIPTLVPGDMMIFTEALIHGDTGWRGDKHRLQIYFKMVPGFMAWRDPRQSLYLSQYAQTDLEKRLIEPPWAGKYSETATHMGVNNIRRPPTRQ